METHNIQAHNVPTSLLEDDVARYYILRGTLFGAEPSTSRVFRSVRSPLRSVGRMTDKCDGCRSRQGSVFRTEAQAVEYCRQGGERGICRPAASRYSRLQHDVCCLRMQIYVLQH